jgi:hypothetical protein
LLGPVAHGAEVGLHLFLDRQVRLALLPEGEFRGRHLTSLKAAIEGLAGRTWRHPTTGEPVCFGFSTIEHWYYRALKERTDPVGVLRRKVRANAGRQHAISDAVRQVVLAQYAAHKSWSVTQQPAHGSDREFGLILAHEPEPFGGIVFVSRANQAAAFDRISLSSLSWRFSRRSWLSSSRSAVVSPLPPRPASHSAWPTQFLIDCAVGSNSCASSSGKRPARTSSTIWRRNSGV